MHKAKIYKAQGIGKKPARSILIEIDEEIPSTSDLLSLFSNEGQKLEALLYYALPGGTYGRLLREMLTRKASTLIVSYGGLQDAS